MKRNRRIRKSTFCGRVYFYSQKGNTFACRSQHVDLK